VVRASCSPVAVGDEGVFVGLGAISKSWDADMTDRCVLGGLAGLGVVVQGRDS
jgi:hypothetical protein